MPAPYNPTKKLQEPVLIDPVGRCIHVPADFCLEGLPLRIEEPAAGEWCNLVIENPACIIEASSRIFYFRSLDWNFTLLVEAAYRDGIWRAVGCQKNPAPDYIQTLLKGGTFVAAESLHQTL